MASYPNYTYRCPEPVLNSNYSHSEEEYSDDSSSSSTYDEYEPVWLENIGEKGELFYIEPETTDLNVSLTLDNTPPKTENNKTSKYSKNKTTKKFKEWMKKRKKKTKSSDQTLSNSANGVQHVETRLNFDSQRSLHVEDKDIYLNVDISQYNYGRRATLSEKLFGIVTSPFVNSLKEYVHDNRVMVSSILFNGEAYKEGTIKIGDWLKCVNDQEVTITNLNSVLETIISPNKVKLTVSQYSVASTVSSDTNLKNCLLQHLSGSSDISSKSKFALYFFSEKDENANDGNEEIDFRYPATENELFKQKGMFLTLNRMIADVGTPPVISCSILIQTETVHIAFVNEGKGLMLLALPNQCASVTEVEHFAVDITKLLKLQFQTLFRSFGDESNKYYINSLLTMFFNQKLKYYSIENKNKVSTSHLVDILPSVHWFPLPIDLKVIIDDILGQFESADFNDMPDGFYGNRRIYNILGSCFFFKGYLLCSHLNKDDLLDIHLFLQYHQILPATKNNSISRAIIWKEIFPFRKQIKTPYESDYVEVEGRYFIVVVAIKHGIVATILEAAGCTHSASGNPPPDSFYVNLVENTVLILEDSGIFPSINKLFETQIPQIASPSEFLKGEKSNWEIFSSMVGLNFAPTNSNQRLISKRSQSYSNLLVTDASKKTLDVNSVVSKTSDRDLERQQLLSNMGPADGESDVETNLPDDSNFSNFLRQNSISTNSYTGSHDSEDSFHGNLRKRIFSSSYDLRAFHTGKDCLNPNSDGISNLVAGNENTLFYYLHMDPAEGVFLAPTEQIQKWFNNDIGQDLIKKFYNCCLKMRVTFERSLRNKEIANNHVMPQYGLNMFLQAANEQGAMFQYTAVNGSQKKMLSLNFWVVGRLFFAPEPREIYVCYHDSTEQNIVELAFRLGFGLTL